MARPKPGPVLPADERDKLAGWASRPKSTCRLSRRARHGACGATVGTRRSRFVARRLDGLTDEPRSGAPRTVADADVERVVTRTRGSEHANAT